jgi:hypothetical protein
MAGAIRCGNHCRVLDEELLNGIIRLLMRIDANVQALLDALTEEDGEDEEPES